jgi:ligand-binding sensor domain-containing protein/serine phosphatase RsbU (regulator of sigma subunit)
MSFRNLIWFCVYLVFSSAAKGQIQEFEHLSDENGLISSNVSAVVKDSEGFVWIGTKQGLDRYDAYSCRHFVNEPTNPNSISENNIRCLYDDGDGKIYIGFYSRGFSIYDKRTETFENYSTTETNSKTNRKDSVFCFYKSRSGQVWMGTSLGLDRFDPITKQTVRFEPFKDLGRKEVCSFAPDKEGNLWLYGPGNVPCKFNTTRQNFELLKLDSINTDKGQHLTALILDRNDNIWFGNEWEGLCKYSLKTKKLQKFQLKNGLLKSNIINSIIETNDGHIWIGTEGAGLYMYDTKRNTFEKFQYIANLPNNLRSNNISCLYESHPGIIWIGSTTYGISIWKKDKIKFDRYGIKGDDDKRLSTQSVLSIAPAPDGKVWIGTDGGGLNLFDPQAKTFRYYTAENSALCNNSIKSIYTDKAGTMWFGTFGPGLCNINFSTKKSTNFQKELIGDEKKGIANCAWTICRTRDNKLWIGLIQGGIRVLDLNSHTFINVLSPHTEFKKLISLRIQVIFEDSKRRIWIGTENFGLICYYPHSRGYTHFPPNEADTFALKSKNVKTVFEDSKGNVWVGMQKGGLAKLESLEKKRFRSYTMKDGLPNNNVKDIVEDHHGNLWLGTEKGISCFYVKDQFFRNFDMQDGLQGANFHSNSNYMSPEGYIYMGGIDGFNVFHPDSLHFNRVAPKMAITDFKIFDKSINPNYLLNEKRYTDASVNFLNGIELSHSDDVFTIEFAALEFLAPHKNKYAYKMEGFNENWTYVDAEHRLATYTNLNPGTYVFRVIAANGDGVWNKEGLSLEITINPPYYLTWWFRLMVFAIFIAALITLYFWRTRSIRIRNAQLKDEVETQTKKLRETNEALQNTAKELEIQFAKSNLLYEELTAGLEAAKVIQNAILPDKDDLVKKFGQIDILYKPKDVVSGDFYWFTEVGDKKILAVVDCTGHGVAGAFMTFVGYEILNQISKLETTADPGKIISMLNQEILDSMNHYRSGSVNAGMDVSMCVLDDKTGLLQYAGANNPLYIVRGEELLIYKGDRQGIGGKQKSENYAFTTHTVPLVKGDQIYIFSDGYADQLGGATGQEKFMYSQFRQMMLELRTQNVKTRIATMDSRFCAWQNGAEQLDDVLVIGFEYHKE